jgi:hypothetical protein
MEAEDIEGSPACPLDEGGHGVGVENGGAPCGGYVNLTEVYNIR